MSGAQLLFLLIVFAVVVALALLAWLIFFPGTLRQRLFGSMAPAASESVADTGWVERVARVAQPFSKLSLPEEGWERSPLRTRFMNAGWRQASAPALYFAAKTVLALLFPTVLGLYAASAMAAQLRSVLLLLRVHSENLRGKRSLLAEEAAAKIALKLLFPLIFCVFPTLMLVLMGPAVIEVYRVLVPAMANR